MKKHRFTLLSVIFVSAILFWIYYSMMPRWRLYENLPLSEYSVKRAMVHVTKLASQPHYTGSAAHSATGDYLISQLRGMGLEVNEQKRTSLSDWGNLVQCRNIMARIKGTGSGKAVLLLSHYDSAPHSYSMGAADDASGVATILEGVRAYLYARKSHVNDIIILFSDAEELGLNGAALFVGQHPWARDAKIAINLEARGTAGPSYMLLETNAGNAGLVQSFANAGPSYPVANSLMYSIYKMLPNDTDLTVFREYGDIPGYNFAFIDDHFNYHTAQDDVAHLSRESLAHQGSYVMPLLEYFADSNLADLSDANDRVYFSVPYAIIHYPFGWNFVLLGVTIVIFLLTVFVGMGKRILVPGIMGRGLALFMGVLATCGIIGFFGWKAIAGIYPEYADILHGFPYNGHSYITAFIFLALAVCFFFYSGTDSDGRAANYFVAPLLLWLIINTVLAIFLPGAGFFIFPTFAGVLMLGFFVLSQRSSALLNVILSIAALIVLAPLTVMFPIGLGMKLLAGSAVLIALIFGLLLPIFANFNYKPLFGALFTLLAVGMLIHAHINSGFEPGKARPNSLLYVYDADKDLASWATYDRELDPWTHTYLGDKVRETSTLHALPLSSKYNSSLTRVSEALIRTIPEPSVTFLRDTIVGKYRHLKIRIQPNRSVNRYDIFANPKAAIHNLRANGASPIGQKGSYYRRKGQRLLSYYVTDNRPLELEFAIAKDLGPDLEMLECSFDLMTNPLFEMARRKPDMMPKPFVLTDAVVIYKRIVPQPKSAVPIPVRPNFTLPNQTRDTIGAVEEMENPQTIDE